VSAPLTLDQAASVVELANQGKTSTEIAELLGVTRWTVMGRLKMARRVGLIVAERRKGRPPESMEYAEMEGAPLPRCRCGLLLPCEGCLPPIEYYARQQSRDAE